MTQADTPWWQAFFDAEYLRVWHAAGSLEHDVAEAEALWRLLGLRAGSRVLDAPCGYGRLSILLATRGADVVGVDQSQALLEQAERMRVLRKPPALRYVRQDLRDPLAIDGVGGSFDAAFNVYTSLGYGSEADDLCVLRRLHDALRPGGSLFVECVHRDAMLAQQQAATHGMAGGLRVHELPRFDADQQRLHTRWSWQAEQAGAEIVRHTSVHLYSDSELAELIVQAGFQIQGSFDGCSVAPFRPRGRARSLRLGILARRALVA